MIPNDKKAFLKMTNYITDPHLCDALITNLEARREQLNQELGLNSTAKKP